MVPGFDLPDWLCPATCGIVVVLSILVSLPAMLGFQRRQDERQRPRRGFRVLPKRNDVECIEMTLAQPNQTRATPEVYLRYEYDATERHEYRDGEVVAMAGGTANHALIIMNVGGELRSRLKGKPCRVYDSNLRVRSVRRSLYTYPDATVICGEPQFDPADKRGQTVINPKVIIEVVSASSEGDDRGEKFDRYRGIESLEEYVLVSQTTPKVETFLRQTGGAWLYHVTEGRDATATLRSVAVELPLTEVFAGVEFSADRDSAGTSASD